MSLLMISFMIAAPLVLLFASGYRYNWRKHKIEKTGIIHVTTVPEGAAVTVDGKDAKDLTPVSIPNLMPEEYRVDVSMAGYMHWTKKLNVESGRTTFVKSLTLLRDELPQLIQGADISISTFSNDGTAVAYLATDEEWSELSLHDIRTRDTLLLARFAKDKYDDVKISLSADGTCLLFEGYDESLRRRTLVIYPADVAGRGRDVAPNLGGSAGLTTSWSLGGSSMVAVGDAGAFTVDKTLGTIDPLPAGRSYRSAFQSAESIWLVREGKETDLLERIRPDRRSPAENYIALPRKGFRFVGGSERYLILTDGRVGGGLLIDTHTGGLRELPHATGAEWEHPDGTGRLLLWSDFEIFTIDPEKPEASLITRIGSGINACAWHPEGTYVLYATGDGITAVEMDNRDRRNIHQLVTFDMIGSMKIDRESGLLRFVGSIGNQKGIFERPL